MRTGVGIAETQAGTVVAVFKTLAKDAGFAEIWERMDVGMAFATATRSLENAVFVARAL